MTATSPRIYVACLSSYNAGRLHGKFLDVNDLETLQEEIHDILKTSPEPNVTRQDFECDCGHRFWQTVAHANEFGSRKAFDECPMCGADATCSGEPYASSEEYAVHDHEGFYKLNIGEHPDLEKLVELAEALEEHGAAFAAYLNHLGGLTYLDDAVEKFEEAFRGTFKSAGDYVEELTRDTAEIPDFLEYYIDWEKMARDFELNGTIFMVESEGGDVYIFDGTV